MFIRAKDFREHTQQDSAQFDAITKALKTHDTNVDQKHRENQKAFSDIQNAQNTMQASLDDIVKLRPDIEAGIAADRETKYRKQLFRRVLLAVITTAATVGGILPLVQWLATLHIHIGVS